MSPNLVQRLSAEALGTLLLVYFGAAARRGHGGEVGGGGCAR
jgi:hypothetical protein